MLRTKIWLAWSVESWHNQAELTLHLQSGRPPYNIDPKVAFEAEAVVKAMLKAGHDLSRYGYHWLMETQVLCYAIMHSMTACHAEKTLHAQAATTAAVAITSDAVKLTSPLNAQDTCCVQSKAGLGDKAYETYTWMLQRGYPADAYTVAHLVEGYGRSSQPIKAQEVFDTVVEQHNITLSVTPWNILLAAYAKCGHMVKIHSYRASGHSSSTASLYKAANCLALQKCDVCSWCVWHCKVFKEHAVSSLRIKMCLPAELLVMRSKYTDI